MHLHASGWLAAKSAPPPGSAEGGGPEGGMEEEERSARTSTAAPELVAGSEGRLVPSGEGDSAAGTSAGAELSAGRLGPEAASEAAGPELGHGPPGGTAECRERVSLRGTIKRRHTVQRIHCSLGKRNKACGGGQKHWPRLLSRRSLSMIAHSSGWARSKSSTAGSAGDAPEDVRCWEWIGGMERATSPCVTKACASAGSPAEMQGGESPAASSGKPEWTPGQEERRPPGGGAG